MTNLMLVEDHASFRQALAFLLDMEEGFRVVDQAGTLAEARQAATKAIEIAVVDLILPDGSGIEFIMELREINPRSVVLVLTASMDSEEAVRATAAGANEVLHKTVGVGEIVQGVKRLAAARK